MGNQIVTDAQNNNENHSQIEFYGISLTDLLAMDRINVDTWACNLSYLNSKALSVVMEIEEIAVNELLSNETLPFAVSEIVAKIENRESRSSYVKYRINNAYRPVNWKRVKRDFDKMEVQKHIVVFEGNDPGTTKVKYRTTTEFRQMVSEYYEQFAKTVRIMMACMQMNDSAASLAELVADNPTLIRELGLEAEEDD